MNPITSKMTPVVQDNPIPDCKIIERVLTGEKDLFEIIIRTYNPNLHKIGRSYGFNHVDTQDLMQETFVSAYSNLSKFEYRSSLKTWIIRIMLHNCFHKKQKATFLLEKPSHISDNSIPMYSNLHEHDGDKKVINAELLHIIEKALQSIPLDYRMAFSLREITGLSVVETAEALDITKSNVKVRVNRGKKMLRKELEKSYSAQDLFEFNLIYCSRMVERVMGEINETHPGNDVS